MHHLRPLEVAAAIPWPILVTVGWSVSLLVHRILTFWTLRGVDDAAVGRETRQLRV